MNDSLIMQDQATGEQIDQILKKVIPVVAEDPTNHVIIASLFLAIIAQNPNLSFDQMQRAVESTSQFICLFLDTLEDETRQADAIDLDTFTPTVIN